MAYSTVDQVKEILQGFVETTGEYDITPAQLSVPQIESAIANADAEIDLVLRRKYKLPLLTPYPQIVVSLSKDIAAALSDMTFRGSREYASESNPFRLRYQRARRILQGIADGTYAVYDDEDEVVSGNAIVLNPYPGDVLLTEHVFPSGGPRFGRGDAAEYGEVIEPIPYYPYLGGR